MADIRAQANAAAIAHSPPVKRQRGKVQDTLISPPKSVIGDKEFINYIQYLQEVKIYYTLKYTIKYANISLLQQIIPRYYIYFHGLNTIKYRYKMLYL